MNLPPTYRHDYGYEPPRPARVYDIPQIVERRPALGRLGTVLMLIRQRMFAGSSSRLGRAVAPAPKPTAGSQRARTSAR